MHYALRVILHTLPSNNLDKLLIIQFYIFAVCMYVSKWHCVIGGDSDAVAAVAEHVGDGARPRHGVTNMQPKQTAFVSVS